jgi:hypothetical protein
MIATPAPVCRPIRSPSVAVLSLEWLRSRPEPRVHHGFIANSSLIHRRMITLRNAQASSLVGAARGTDRVSRRDDSWEQSWPSVATGRPGMAPGPQYRRSSRGRRVRVSHRRLLGGTAEARATRDKPQGPTAGSRGARADRPRCAGNHDGRIPLRGGDGLRVRVGDHPARWPVDTRREGWVMNL